MAGTNPYTVNRILNQWERNGYIEKGRKRLRICEAVNITEISAWGLKSPFSGSNGHSTAIRQ